jgi:hypothetical protein
MGTHNPGGRFDSIGPDGGSVLFHDQIDFPSMMGSPKIKVQKEKRTDWRVIGKFEVPYCRIVQINGNKVVIWEKNQERADF